VLKRWLDNLAYRRLQGSGLLLHEMGTPGIAVSYCTVVRYPGHFMVYPPGPTEFVKVTVINHSTLMDAKDGE
jgi:hypothetical protein